MAVPIQVELTKAGGLYYRALTFHWVITILFIIPTTVVVLLGLLNPFWFREAFMEWIVRRVNDFAHWRNYRKYAIYLDCDPEYWHTLNGTQQKR